MKFKILSIVFFSLIFSSVRVLSQAENYPYYLDYYWGNRDRNFAIKVTNKLINTTEKGRQYIDESNCQSKYQTYLNTVKNVKTGFTRKLKP